MSTTPTQKLRILSGMRPTGLLHLGHYHGVIKNWVEMQNQYDCFFFVADWHALTTHYETPDNISQHVEDLAIDWLAAGLDPEKATIFVQSQVPQHAELHLALSMITPLGWLERVPTYKDQQEKLKERDLATYGFLGYPLLQSADILLYKADLVPVGEDQVAHIELTREVARRFNHLYGREANHEAKLEHSLAKMSKKHAKSFKELRRQYQEQGNAEALVWGRNLLAEQHNLSAEDRERLLGYLDGTGKVILPEPQAALTKASKMPGLDGQKMSKSYNNTIALRDSAETVDKKIRTMPTDTNRVRRTDPGEPSRCPVWQLHEIYSDDATKDWVQQGCRSAGIGCIECKQPIIKAVQAELAPMQARAAELEADRNKVREILAAGAEKARVVAKQTMHDVMSAMRFTHYQ